MDLAFGDLQVQAVEGGDMAERLAQVPDSDDLGHQRSLVISSRSVGSVSRPWV
ncbi:Uncharacterised protein [Mycobacteroides abscessus subsp. abscessus]|nr:Uncharacterised protein [Mycobacteroides abscessus subsp. abscessus]